MEKYYLAVNGKHLINSTGQNDHVQIIYALNNIANELAEANRLKRIEITFQYESCYGKKKLGEYDSKELEKLLDYV